MSNLISCPNCHHEIAINEVVQTQLSEKIRAELQAELSSKKSEIAEEQKRLAERESVLAKQQKQLSAQVAAGVEVEKAKIVAAAQKQAKESIGLELQDRAGSGRRASV